MIREWIVNSLIGLGRTTGRLLGLQLAVEVSDHSITLQMEAPDRNERAWDRDLYKHGNLFVSNYANPIKPQVDPNPELEESDEVRVEEGDGDGDSEDAGAGHVELISSGRYREYMRQDLIAQLLTPESRWNLLVWGIIGVAVLGFLQIIVTLWTTGSFQ